MKKAKLLLIFLLISLFSFAQTTLIPLSAEWKYLDNGSDQGTEWTLFTYDDAAWKSGPAELGYGDNDEATKVGFGGNSSDKFITTYFRRQLLLSGAFLRFDATIYRDDGAIVYVNGKEVYRTNLQGGSINYRTRAESANNDDGENAHSFTIDPSVFVDGINVIAVEVHQDDVNSSDISFRLELVAQPGETTDLTPPLANSITRQIPLEQQTSLSEVTYAVNFSEAVTGLDATDFALNTVSGNATGSITEVKGSGAAYTVTITGIAGEGDLRLDLNSTGTGITDLVGNALPGGFITGELYTFTSTDLAPAVSSVLRSNPTTQNTTATTVTYAVNFSEAVTGVDAADFSLATTGTASGTIGTVGGTGAAYTVTITGIAGEGDLRLDVINAGTGIADVSGNPLAGGFASGQSYLVGPGQNNPTATLTRGPYLQMANQTGVTLRWRTNVATDSKIEVGSSAGNYTLSATDPAVTTEHIIRMEGLTADTRYYYRFGSSTQVLQGGSDHFFSTAPPATTTRKLRIAAFGDCGKAGATQTAVLNAYLQYTRSNPADLLLLLGDNAYDDGLDNEYQSEFFKPYQTTILRNHVLFPTPGNHEYHSTSPQARTAPYYQIFSVPSAAECGGVASGTKAYYSFDWGNIHFISLDSEGEEAGGTRLYDTLGQQVVWLKKDLAVNTKKWTVVFFHHPPYSKGSHDADTDSELGRIRRNLVPVLERYGVDLVLSGHTHVYERSYLLRGYYGTESSFNPSVHTASNSSAAYDGSSNSCPYVTTSGQTNHGTVYVVAATSSRDQVDVASSFPHTALPFATRAGGSFYLEVEDNRLDGKMIDRNGDVFDQFTILKDAGKTLSIAGTGAESHTLTASWVGDYRWSTGENTRSITVAPGTTTTYTVTDSKGCLRDQYTVSVALTLANRSRALIPTTALPMVYPTNVKRGARVTVQTSLGIVYEGQLLDNNGRQVRQFTVNGSTQLNTDGLPAGIYFLDLRSQNKSHQLKLVVSN
jgi:hypothetical protein